MRPISSEALKPRSCPNAACKCHIGYAFMPEMEFAGLFGDSLAHRIPQRSLDNGDKQYVDWRHVLSPRPFTLTRP